jgi:phosphatidylglycerol---prolipoprotein diacylglyceryl transferase
MNVIEIDISPVLFHLGSLEVRWYGVMMALGVMVLLFWTYNQIRRGASISYDTLQGAALVGIPSGIIFARLLHVLDGSANIDYYFSEPSRIIGGAGLTIYGAILGAALGVWVYSRINKINYSYLVDVITPGIILAQVLGRIGCLFNGCCYGKEVSGSPFNIIYSNIETFGPLGQPVQPTQFYEILFLLGLFTVIMIFRSKFKPTGVQFLLYLGMYSLWRIGIGFLRVGTPFAFGLEQAQVIGIITATICFLLIAYRVYKFKTESQIIENTAAAEIEKKV